MGAQIVDLETHIEDLGAQITDFLNLRFGLAVSAQILSLDIHMVDLGVSRGACKCTYTYTQHTYPSSRSLCILFPILDRPCVLLCCVG